MKADTVDALRAEEERLRKEADNTVRGSVQWSSARMAYRAARQARDAAERVHAVTREARAASAMTSASSERAAALEKHRRFMADAPARRAAWRANEEEKQRLLAEFDEEAEQQESTRQLAEQLAQRFNAR